MLRKTLPIFSLFTVAIVFATSANATFIPPEDIKKPYMVYSERDANMTEEEFNEVIEKARGFYAPIVRSHGGRLAISGAWDNDTLNATASQFFGRWNVNMYGGLARHPEMTLDGFAMVVCHEMGHHLGGFPFYQRNIGFGGVWAANEGQSDYFAAYSCARDLWEDELTVNESFRGKVPVIVAEACNSVWETVEEQNLCYRINAGGDSLARVLADLKEDPAPANFETPDENKVNMTADSHPETQCRLDTMFAATLCKANFDTAVIPGKALSDPFGTAAEKEAAQQNCTEYGSFEVGNRPRCWFRPRI